MRASCVCKWNSISVFILIESIYPKQVEDVECFLDAEVVSNLPEAEEVVKLLFFVLQEEELSEVRVL